MILAGWNKISKTISKFPFRNSFSGTVRTEFLNTPARMEFSTGSLSQSYRGNRAVANVVIGDHAVTLSVRC